MRIPPFGNGAVFTILPTSRRHCQYGLVTTGAVNRPFRIPSANSAEGA